jgi:hypothetical protein
MPQRVWLGNDDSLRLYADLFHSASERKLRLGAAACCRRVWPLLLDERSKTGMDVFENHADGTVPWKAFHRARIAAEAAFREMQERWPYDGRTEEQNRWIEAAVAVDCLLKQEQFPARKTVDEGAGPWVLCAIRLAGRVVAPGTPDLMDGATSGERAAQADLLRDIFGNPFRPVAFGPEWRSDTAVSLARHIYESRDFSTMPILADALQDAGCDNADILNHCRDPQQVHVRGCWVVDLVLGKA